MQKSQVFDFTLVCKLKGLNLQLQNSATLFLISIVFHECQENLQDLLSLKRFFSLMFAVLYMRK